MVEKIKGIILLCVIFYLITGEWPDFNDPDCQNAIMEVLDH